MAAGPRTRRGLPDALALADKHYFPPSEAADPSGLPLRRLFSAGVECGHTQARAELKRRVAIVDDTLADLDAPRDHAMGGRQRRAREPLSRHSGTGRWRTSRDAA